MKNRNPFPFLLIFSSLLYGCATGPTISEYVSPYPGNSVTKKAPLLEKQAIEGLRKMVQDKRKCEQFQLIDRKVIEVSDKFVIDQYGRLYVGGARELWSVKACGQDLKLDFFVANEGNRGANSMLFVEHASETK